MSDFNKIIERRSLLKGAFALGATAFVASAVPPVGFHLRSRFRFLCFLRYCCCFSCIRENPRLSGDDSSIRVKRLL